jgi:hypothetical protein
MSIELKLIIGGIALAVFANYWLYKSEVACEEAGGTYVRAVWGYKCVELK